MAIASNNFINDLIAVGNDAQSHLFEVTLSGGYFDNEFSKDLTIRCSGFTPPAEPPVDTYQVKYITAFIDRPKTKINITHNFSLEFRMDANWNVFDILAKQMMLTSNPQNNYSMSSDYTNDNSNLFNITVKVLNVLSEDSNEPEAIFKYYGCWITGLKHSNFTSASADPMKATVDISYLKAEDIQSGIA